MIEITDDTIVEKRTIKCRNPIEFDKYFIDRIRELSESNDILFHTRITSLNSLISHKYEIEYRKR